MPRNLSSLTARGALGAALLLAACATPQEQCVARQTSEYRVVSRLLAEIEGNLSRGYAWHERQVTRTEWDECPAIRRGRGGKRDIVSRPCLRDVTETERERVAIDPVTETRKRDNLRQRLKALAPAAAAGTRACQRAYPEEGPRPALSGGGGQRRLPSAP